LTDDVFSVRAPGIGSPELFKAEAGASISSIPVTKVIVFLSSLRNIRSGFRLGFGLFGFGNVGMLLNPAALMQPFDDANHQQITRQIPIWPHRVAFIEEEHADEFVVRNKWRVGIALGSIRRFLKF